MGGQRGSRKTQLEGDKAGSGKRSALIYCRVSTAKQEEEGTSLDSQTAACIAHAEQLGYTIGRVTKEVFSGAELFDRPLLSRDRADIRAGQFAAVVVYAIDRLSRDVAHLAILSEEIERAGATLMFVTEDLDKSPEGKLMASVRAYVAEVERLKIRERCVRGKRQRLLSGKLYNLGPELYGYQRDRERGVRLVHPEESRIVQKIFEYVGVEGAGLLTIAKRLSETGVPSPWAAKGFGSRGWNATAVRNIIRNPSYKGETWAWIRKAASRTRIVMRPREEWIRLSDEITPAVVTPEVWQRAQERLAKNSGESKRNQERPYLLRGHITCALCGSRMYPMPCGNSNKPRPYYRCSSYVKRWGRKCGASVVPAGLCEQWAWEELKSYLQTPDLIAREVERLQDEGIDKQLLKDREVAQASLDRHTQGMQRLVRSLRTVEDDLAVIIERELLQAEREKQALLKTLADLDARIARQEQVTINLRSLYEYCQQVEEELERFEFDDQRLALEALGAEVIANGREWKIVARFPGSVVEVESVSSNSSRPTSAPATPRPPYSAATGAGAK